MLAQAAGTGASVGAMVVSESDMSVVLLCDGEGASPALLLSSKCQWIPTLLSETEEGMKGEGTGEEVGGDKHVREASTRVYMTECV